MTDIEKKALALMHEVRLERRMPLRTVWLDRPGRLSHEALCRAIEQHEAFRQEVSDAVESCIMRLSKGRDGLTAQTLARFIIAKPDPLVEAWLEAFPGNHIEDAREECAKISAALAARGFEIREKQA